MNIAELITELRSIADDCEEGARNPKTGVSDWPKEDTAEWKAAELIGAQHKHIENLQHYINALHESETGVSDVRFLKMIERVALAIEKADNEFIEEGFYKGSNPDISDWGAYLAVAALHAMGVRFDPS